MKCGGKFGKCNTRPTVEQYIYGHGNGFHKFLYEYECDRCARETRVRYAREYVPVSWQGLTMYGYYATSVVGSRGVVHRPYAITSDEVTSHIAGELPDHLWGMHWGSH